MGVTIATTRVAAETGGGNQDITTSDLGGLTPTAALLLAVQATSDGTPADDAGMCIGFVDGTRQRVVAVTCEHGQGTMDTARRGTDDECVLLLDPGDNTVECEASFTSFIENGIRITWDNNPGSAWYITAVFFAGTDVSAYVGEAAIGNQNVTTDVTDPSFQPDVVLLASIGMSVGTDTGDSHAMLSLGAAVDDGSDTQACCAWSSQWSVGTSIVCGALYDNRAAAQVFSDSETWTAEVGSFDANGFSITPRGGNANDDVIYLALEFNDKISCDLSIQDTPTSTGSHSVTGIGFEPQFVLLGLSQLTSTNTLDTAGNGASIGISVGDENEQYCVSIQDEDGQSTSDTQSLSNDQMIDFPNDDGSQAHVASLSSLDSGGWTWNFTATEGTAVKFWALSFESGAVIVPQVMYHRQRRV